MIIHRGLCFDSFFFFLQMYKQSARKMCDVSLQPEPQKGRFYGALLSMRLSAGTCFHTDKQTETMQICILLGLIFSTKKKKKGKAGLVVCQMGLNNIYTECQNEEQVFLLPRNVWQRVLTLSGFWLLFGYSTCHPGPLNCYSDMT